jgi:LysM repeat protein
VLTGADRAKFAPAMTDPLIQVLSPSAMAMIATGQPAFAPGTYLKASDSSVNYLIDGYDRALIVPSAEKAAQLGLLAKPRVVKPSDFKGYNKKVAIETSKVLCQDQLFMAVGGKLSGISVADAAHYPGTVLSLDALTCATLKKNLAADDRLNQIGRFIRTPDRQLWLVQRGKKRLIANAAAYQLLVGDRVPLVAVDAYFGSLIPVGAKAPATLVEATPTPSSSPSVSPSASPSASATPKPSVSASPTASATPKPTTTATPKPTVSATPTPTASPRPTVSATPSPTPTVKPATYTVVSGDTLIRIATRFGVTLTALMTANKITDANNIRIGQVLQIP